MSPLRWTCKSLRRLADELRKLGHEISHRMVGKILAEQGFSLQANSKTREGSDHEESRVRIATAERMLAQGLEDADDPVELVARVLRCHEPSPDLAICGHPDESDPPADQGMTVGSMICDLDERRIHVCAGAPCENAYQTFGM